MKAYCTKCREQKEMEGVKGVILKNGRTAQQGVCPDCGTKMIRFGGAT